MNLEINGENLKLMVNDFYDRVRTDPLLGPIFEGAIKNWDPHLETMVSFWRSVMLAETNYHGSPSQAHRQLEGLSPAHFSRWMELFEETVFELFTAPEAVRLMNRAGMMREGLSRAVFGRPEAQVCN